MRRRRIGAATTSTGWNAHARALLAQQGRRRAAVLAAINGRRCATCALRPHLIWGPRDAHLIPRLIDRARRGRLRRVGDGTNLVDICYVENAAAAHLAAADALADPDSPVGRPAYFISQGEPVNCWQWIDEVLALAGLPPVRKSISFKAAWRLGAACEAVYRTAAPARRAADDAVPRRPTGQVALVRHFRRPPRFRLRAASFDRRRHAAPRRVAAAPSD